DIFAFDEISRLLKHPIQQAVVREADLLSVLDDTFSNPDQISSIAEELQGELSESDIDLMESGDISDAPVIRFLETLFERAVQLNASDIHIEPDEKVLRIRQRVDGVLQEQIMKEVRIAQAVVLKLKLMASLNISEKRVPQDGRFNLKVKNKSIDIRISTLPMMTGESVVMRLLDQSGGMRTLDEIGMQDSLLKRFRRHIHQPNGLVLVTGPTGSGKTTTLYSALNELNTPSVKIITAEDPVEYRLPRINQVQVHNKVGLTFPAILRSALRQDPDVVLIGEMRDQETAEIGLRASMTGHLVLSTLHTNNAISTANRLLDMGAEGYLVAASLKAVIAQRLIRKLCPHCAEPVLASNAQRTVLKALIPDKQRAADVEILEGQGCSQCNGTGYSGRIGIHEILEMDDTLAGKLRRNDSAGFAEAAIDQEGFRTLAMCAMDFVEQGLTTLEEVTRVTGAVD
ncbi:MAG: type II/IV secretion system protein, partial [Methylococcales bacterium]|nr:type II/IV secretion system protein [Methylococcales bacterium]